MNTVEWECPRCGKRATANLDALGALGTILCTCGTRSRPAVSDDGPARCLDCGVDISDLAAQDNEIEWCEDCAGWPGRFTH